MPSLDPSVIIDKSSNAITKIWATERTFFIWIMIAFMMFASFFMWYDSEAKKEQRNVFLSFMEKSDEKTSIAMDKMTIALNRNTEIMIELKTRIK